MDQIAEQLVARLTRDPNDAGAYEDLKTHYRAHQDYASLANLLEGWAGANQEDWQRASDAYTEAADSVMAGTLDRDRAFGLYRLALQMNALHPDAGPRLIALLEEHGDAQQLAEFLDTYARTLHAGGGAHAYVFDLYERLAQLSEHSFGNRELANEYRTLASSLAQPQDSNGAQAPQPGQPGMDSDAPSSEAALKAAELVQTADACSEQGDLAGAIAALRQALSAVPGDVAVMHKLATSLLARAEQADEATARTDQRRVAELFYQIAQGVEDDQALEYLESALDSMPEHVGALGMLERLAKQQNRNELLPRHWVAFVAAAAEGPDLDRRRVLLGEAYLEAGQLADALYCLQPAAEHGDDRANRLLQELYARQAAEGPQADGDEPGATARPRRRTGRDERDESAAKVAELRRLVHEAQTARKHEEAAGHCREILAIDPHDPEAFSLLESHLRKRRDFPALRELLLASTRVPGLAVDVRKLRLREVATLSESKLRDSDAAMSAWRGVVTLDPADREALGNLKRLLKKALQWDEYAGVLEREALTTTSVDEKAALLREIALVHRDKRKDPGETAEAFRQLYALRPDDSGLREELCDLLIDLEQWSDVAPLLRARIDNAHDDVEGYKLSSRLALILHEKLADYDAAFQLCERILQQRPNDRPTFDRMERVDEDGGNYTRLLTTLERRATLALKAERPALYTRMGLVADQKLHDLDRAAEYLGEALDLAPESSEAMEQLVAMFERASRYDQLVELLRERAVIEKEPKNRAPLFRRIAKALAEQLTDEEGAAEAYRSLLAIEEDEPALRFLRELAAREDRQEELADALRRLVVVVQDSTERDALLLDLAFVLHERLERSPEAAIALKRLLANEGAKPVEAIDLLWEISNAAQDEAGMALALDRRIAQSSDPTARAADARRLADLAEGQLRDSERAIKALRIWAKDDAHNPEPLRRLRKQLTAAERWPELLPVLDGLAEWEDEFDARDEAAIEAGKLAFDRMKDAQGAWRRLRPLVEQHNAQAEQELRALANKANMHAALAGLYVELAQQTEDPTAQAAAWGNAADIYSGKLGDDAQALEAGLRRLAADLGNREYLAYVDRLSVHTKSYRRLTGVYDRLLKEARDDDDKVELLSRHAALLERDHPDESLDRVLRACALSPHDEDLLERAEQLAERTSRSEELLVVYDRRRARSDDDADKVHLLLRAVRLCDGPLRDRERANQYMKLAVAAAADSNELALQVELAAAELDTLRPELGADAARRALVRSLREVAERSEPGLAVRLVLRAADLVGGQLDDDRSAFDLLRQGVALQPKSDEVFTALLELAQKLKRLDAVDAHLSRLIEEAIEPSTTVALLRRRGALLEGPLNRFPDAAAVYTKLLQLRPDDAEATDKLQASLRRSGRHQDLLLLLNKQLQRARDRDKRVPLLRQIAFTWERDIRNRWEALDAWKAVLAEAPDDEEALGAQQRLDRTRAGDLDAAKPAETVQGAADDTTEMATRELVALRAETLTSAATAAAVPSDAQAVAAADEKPTEAATVEDVAAEQAPATEASAAPEPEESATTANAMPDAIAAVAVAAAVEAPPAFRPVLAREAPAAPVPDDLDALDASLRGSAGAEEVDVFDALPSVEVDVSLDDEGPVTRPAPRIGGGRASIPSPIRPGSVPPPPPRRASSMPPPPPGSRMSAAPALPPLRAPSVPPPLPRNRAMTSVPPHAPPPIPSIGTSAARAASKPPPLPPKGQSNTSRPPPPPPRKD